MENYKKLPVERLTQIHSDYALLEKFWLSENKDGEYNESLLEQLDTAIYRCANDEVWREALKHIAALKELVSTSMDTAINSAKYILKKAS